MDSLTGCAILHDVRRITYASFDLMPHDPLCDWRDLSAYPADPLMTADERFRNFKNIGGLNADMLRRALWRWEFLRRLSEYRKDWQKLSGTVISSEKYRLAHCFPDPTLPRPYPLWFEDMLGHVSRESPVGRVLFDLSLPLNPQLEYAKQFLKAGAETYRRRHPPIESENVFYRWPSPTKYQRYLRVLDARAAGVSFRDIGQKLLAVEGYNAAAVKASKTFDSACRLQDSLIRVRNNTKEPFTFKAEA